MENLQLVLAGDKGVTTDLTVFLSESERALFVYLGLALLERVEYSANQFAYKMLIGRLVNAGVKLINLKRQFKHDTRTMKRWAKALKSDNPDVIVRAFAGRGPLPKVIGPIIRLVKMRYLSLKGVVRNYRQIIAAEIKECFGETLSRETLRQIFRLAREEQQAAANVESDSKKYTRGQGSPAPSQDSSLSEDMTMNSAQGRHADAGFVTNLEQESLTFSPDGSTSHNATLNSIPVLTSDCLAAGLEEEITPLLQDVGLSGNMALDRGENVSNSCRSAEIFSSDSSLTDNQSTNFLPPKLSDSSACLKEEDTVKHSVAKTVAAEVNACSILDVVSDQSKADIGSSSGCRPPPPPSGLPYSERQPTSQLRALQHVGQILFSPWLDMVSFQRPQAYGLQSQWIGQILQGAVNIEQSHLICATSLALFTGPVLTGLKAQRLKLKNMADADAVLDVYRANGRLLPDGPGMGGAFYYDPHSKECSTMLNMLKGWCGRRHSIAKILHLDLIHTESGFPCFLQHYDNFYDLRERFFITLSLFKKLFPKGRLSGATFILDRGIFGRDIFSKFGAHDCFLITWEKGYKKDGWNAESPAVKFQRYRERNSPGDLKEYSFECQESPWPKDTSIRRIIVRATNSKENTIEVSVLCTNPDMSVQVIVTLIFNRWIQENNLKYLDCHFGLMQITSYASENYKDIAHSLVDRWVDSPEYRELKRVFSAEEQALGKLLLKRERQTKYLKTTREQQVIVNQTLADLEKQIRGLKERLKAPQKSQNLERLKGCVKEYQANRSRLKSKATKLKKQLDDLEKAIKEKNKSLSNINDRLEKTLREKSRLKGLIEGAYQRPDVRRKAMMDALRITAHNMFQNMMAIFRPFYGNYRNDNVMLRMLTRTDGFMWIEDTTIQIRLWLKGRYANHQKRIFQAFLHKMNDFINGHFSGRAEKVEIDIVDTAEQLLTLSRNHGVQLVTHSTSMT